MTTASIKYEEIRATLLTNNIGVSDPVDIDFGLQFSITSGIWKGVIRIYESKKKGVTVDLSQLKNSEEASKIANLVFEKTLSITSSTKPAFDYDLGLPIIGSDESGKGDYFGPLVAAAVYVDDQLERKLLSLGVKDSKTLNDKQNLALSKELKHSLSGKYSIIEVSPERYNFLYSKFATEGKKLNTLLAWCHAKAIEELLGKVSCDKAIADQFADERFILDKLQERGKKITLFQRHKAEQNIAVAAASILARGRFLEKLSKLSDEVGVILPKGASQQVIDTARNLVEKGGKVLLEKVAKLHFKTTNLVLKL